MIGKYPHSRVSMFDCPPLTDHLILAVIRPAYVASRSRACKLPSVSVRQALYGRSNSPQRDRSFVPVNEFPFLVP